MSRFSEKLTRLLMADPSLHSKSLSCVRGERCSVLSPG